LIGRFRQRQVSLHHDPRRGDDLNVTRINLSLCHRKSSNDACLAEGHKKTEQAIWMKTFTTSRMTDICVFDSIKSRERLGIFAFDIALICSCSQAEVTALDL